MERGHGLIVILLFLHISSLTIWKVWAANWGEFKRDGCVLPGYRKYSARLWNIKGDWEKSCRSMEATVQGTYFRVPDNCVNRGLRGEHGEFYVLDATCDPNWGSFKDDGCKGDGRRQFSSVLWDIPSGESWEKWCAEAWAEVDGVFFLQPSRCVNKILNMWGEFDVPDPCCGNGKAMDSITAPTHDAHPRRRLLASGPVCAAAGGSGGIPPHDDNGFPKTPTDAVDDFGADDFDADMLAVYLIITSPNAGQDRQFLASGGNSGGLQQFDVFVRSPSSGIRIYPNSMGMSKGAIRSQSVKALAVPVTSANDLNDGRTIPSGRWFSVSLQNNAESLHPARIIATSQLSGCCFTLGWDDSSRTLYMGHIQPYPQASSPSLRTGENLANLLRQQEQPFDGVTIPAGQVYYIGANSERYGGYGATGVVRANVLGLIGRNAIQIVVQFVNTTSGLVERFRAIPFF
ncbi:hypothetical protein KP509_09G067800 [Ceratopteris richardii]|uniref:Uncharacterized protein n=1 Tax=Ceratopteris richardii TaxID=49495 RepID=A0A8T2U166_CERRI|nr:hypothetical protein KP509_09G067800 [Ceratopteris richardii]